MDEENERILFFSRFPLFSIPSFCPSFLGPHHYHNTVCTCPLPLFSHAVNYYSRLPLHSPRYVCGDPSLRRSLSSSILLSSFSRFSVDFYHSYAVPVLLSTSPPPFLLFYKPSSFKKPDSCRLDFSLPVPFYPLLCPPSVPRALLYRSRSCLHSCTTPSVSYHTTNNFTTTSVTLQLLVLLNRMYVLCVCRLYSSTLAIVSCLILCLLKLSKLEVLLRLFFCLCLN